MRVFPHGSSFTLLALASLLLLSPADARCAASALRVRHAGRTTATLRTPQEQLWYDRMIAGMDASSALAAGYLSGGDSYTVGRGGGDYTESLVMALRSTGEQRFLDRLYGLAELARGSLRDAWLDGTTDGYLQWNWLVDPANATYYGKDTNWLDESITAGNAALWAYTFHVNRDLDPRYAAEADFWRGYLENHFLAKWYARAGGALAAWNTPYAGFYKPDMEPRSANWRLAHYLYKVTGNTFYRDREDEILTELIAANSINPAHPTAYRWPRQTSPTATDWQAVNYCNYYMRAALEMNLEGVRFYSSPVTMKRFAATFRDVVYANSLPGRTTMAANNNGDGSTGFALYAFNGFSAWDSTGFLMNLADQSIVGAGNYACCGQSGAARNDMILAGYALMALSPEGTTPTLVARFEGEPQADGSVRIEWQLGPGSDAAQTDVYRVDGTDGAVRINPSPLLGPGPHGVVDGAPGAGANATYELRESGSGGALLDRIVVQLQPAPTTAFTAESPAPNPFARTTTLAFAGSLPQRVEVRVLDASGRLVRDLGTNDWPAGRHTLAWDGRDGSGRPVPSGLYLISLRTDSAHLLRRAIRMP